MSNFKHLISAQELRAMLGAADLRIVDATWVPAGAQSTARELYRQQHLPGAVFFDSDTIRDASSPLPLMRPAPDAFEAAVGALGIGNDDRVVVYDHSGMTSLAARVWWLFRSYGHRRIAVLDGGLPVWVQVKAATESGEGSVTARTYRCDARPELVCSLGRMHRAIAGTHQIVDTRDCARYEGAAPPVLPTRRAGHIPGALNLPFDHLLAEDGRLKRGEQLRELMRCVGIDPALSTTVYCGSGGSSPVLALALAALGNDTVAVYDGSWSEWNLDDDLPIATGPSRSMMAH
jgi:thiosulfate/3-mercaptopyruvate sulfurtransferase